MSSMEINEVITKNDLFTFLTTRKKYSNSYFIESYFKKIFKTHYENILNFHNKYYDFDIPFNQKLYNYLYDITKLPCCLNCGKNTKYVSFSYGYGTYCSTQCSLHSDVRAEVIRNSHRNKSKEDVEIAIKKREATCLEKYNVTYVSKCEAVKQKMKDTYDDLLYGDLLEITLGEFIERLETVSERTSLQIEVDLSTKNDSGILVTFDGERLYGYCVMMTVLNNKPNIFRSAIGNNTCNIIIKQ